MHWLRSATRAAAFLGLTPRQDPPADSVLVVDEVTGFTFGEFVTDNGISYRIAIPEPVPDDGAYDVVVQVAAPIDMGWVGLAWGGSMTYNPLTIAWQNDDSVTTSSRFAFGYYVPPPYDDATYTPLTTGTFVNETHWQYTVKCTGCTTWGDDDIGYTTLDPTAQNALAFAFSQVPPDDPADPESAFSIHESVGHWYHDFGNIGNEDFDELVSKNSEGPGSAAAGGSTGTPSTESPKQTATTTDAESTAMPTTAPTSSAASLPFPDSCQGVPDMQFPHSVADGWNFTKVADGLTSPRTTIFDQAGNLLVLEAGMGISVHTFGPDGCLSSSETALENRNLNHGLTLAPDGKTLYASSMTTAWRWTWDPVTRQVSDQTVVLTGMNNGGHSTRSIYVAPNHPNLIVVSVGSNSNWDYESESMETGRAAVKVFDMDTMPDGGYQYNTQGWQFGYGLRNEVGLAFDPSNMVWGVENGGDDFERTVNGQATDIHNENPADELNYLGDPSEPNTQWYGYPTCHAVWDPSLIIDKSFKTGDQFVVTPNATFDDSDCADKTVPPRLSFQAHSAPISAIFDTAGDNMYVTLHGSWDRTPPTGYKLVEIPFQSGDDGAFEPTAAADSREGYRDILWNTDVNACGGFTGNKCFRPAAVVWDNANSRLVVSSDSSGELYIMAKA